MSRILNCGGAFSSQSVRSSAVELLPMLYMYMGPALRVLFENEKPALLQQIDAEFSKVGETVPLYLV